MSLEDCRHLKKAFFLDRDDTIIKDYGYLNDPLKVELLEGVPEALKHIQQQGYLLIVITNQSGLTRGLVQFDNLQIIHQRISDQLALKGVKINGYYSAPYEHDHPRRKPGSKLLIEAANDWGIDLKSSWMAGDKWRDLESGLKVGCKTLLVNEAPNQKPLLQNLTPDITLKTWNEFSVDQLT